MKHYDIAAYIWPEYTGDEPRTRIFWPEGMGEWQSVKNAKPKACGYSWSRKPLWGYVNEADPYVMEMEIEAAVDHGVNVFIYDWYWYDGRPFLENCLNDGFLRAKNNEKMKFYIMWANHDANHLWNKELSDTEAGNEIIWRGAVDRDEFENAALRIINQYFVLPNYTKINGCPVFAIFSTELFVKSFGTEENAVEAMKYMREQVRKAGFPDMHYMMMDGGGFPCNDAGKARVDKRLFLKPDSWALYNMGGFDTDYMKHCQNAMDYRADWDKYMDIPVFPTVSIGWDDTPRFPAKGENDVTRFNHSPEAFKNYLFEAKKYADEHPEQPKFVMINAWNEWVEGSYLLPVRYWGYAWLEAVRDVFGPVE